MSDWRVSAGCPAPLGVTPDARGVNVAVFSSNATRIEFCLFDATGEVELARLALPERTGDVFHAHIAGVPPGARYGLRAAGPWAPGEGHRFNPYKLLVDPYASRLDRPFQLAASLFDMRARGAVRDEADSAASVPKAIVPEVIVSPAGEADRRSVPPFRWDDEVFYELHVRGFTRLNPDIPLDMRGTFAALAQPVALEHLVNLGITTVELMPAMAWIDERHLPPLGLTNYWGYNPVAFGAPDPRLAPGGFEEVARAVAALHGAGIKVVLDVVLNHTGESDEFGPTVSLRGLDNATYYRHAKGDAGRLINDAGTGNTLALERAPVLQLGMDMLRRWAGSGLDGFRFDLAATLGRRVDGFDPEAPFLAALQQDPTLRDLALIAEPWDIGPGGYQVGQFPPGWGEWNDKFRDTARRFWRGDAPMIGELATRLAGSADVFAARRRPLSRAINFVTAHDGFTAADLVAFAAKHNEANGENNRDGTDENHSWNHGVEGQTDNPAVMAARHGDVRALLATLLVARGTPMLTMGDECGRSQAGNNNAYAQDNVLTWLDWSKLDGALAAFTARLVKLRRDHRALRLEAPLTGRPIDPSGIADVEWRAADGGAPAWDDASTRALVAVFYAPATDDAAADRVAVVLNASGEALALSLPAPREGFDWQAAADTAHPDGAGATTDIVAARSVLILVEVAVPDAPRRASDPALLETLAAAAGIAPEWWDVEGTHHPVSDDTKRALLAALHLPAGTNGEVRDSLAKLSDQRFGRDVPFARVLRAGQASTLTLAGAAAQAVRRLDLVIRLEDGGEIDVAVRPEEGRREETVRPDGRRALTRTVDLPQLPVGRHTLMLGDAACRLTMAPHACYLPPEFAAGARRFGIGAHLYTLRRAQADQGIGDFTALGELAELAGAQGAAVLGLNPLHALFPGDRERASPYSPSDRRFLDPIYIDVAALGADVASFAPLAAEPAVDYPAVWAAKQAVLRAGFAAFDASDASFGRFITEGGERLRRFAIFQAIAATHPRAGWRDWPDGLSDAASSAVDGFAEAHAGEVRFALWQQWVADRQFAGAAERAQAAGLSLGFYRDLAVGTAPDGAEAWSEAALIMQGVSIGAPPDPLGPEGQNWNLPPFDPLAWQREGYEGFARLVAANMRHAGALRIDHVMGLRRLFLIPDGANGTDGTYLSMPFEDLAGQVALESHRAKCLVVGEDLGTVPAGMREQLNDERMLSYRVLWFERQGAAFVPPRDYPALAAACVSTHDLPTIAGWWDGVDLAERRTLGLENDASLASALAARAAEKAELAAALLGEGLIAAAPEPGAALSEAFEAALHAYVARTPSVLALAQIDDLAGEAVAVNLPGTDRERPNWRRRLGRAIEAVMDDARARAVLAAMKAERGADR